MTNLKKAVRKHLNTKRTGFTVGKLYRRDLVRLAIGFALGAILI